MIGGREVDVFNQTLFYNKINNCGKNYITQYFRQDYPYKCSLKFKVAKICNYIIDKFKKECRNNHKPGNYKKIIFTDNLLAKTRYTI